MTRLVAAALTPALVLALAVGPALAWQCPVQWKAAEEAIKKAEALNLPGDAKALVAEAKKLVAEAKKHHEGEQPIDHAHSMWKAKAALAQAEAGAGVVLGIVTPGSAPGQWKAAEEAIKKAEVLRLPPDAQGLISDAKKFVAESRKHHQSPAKIDQANSMWKARAALAQAETAAVLATP